MTEKDWKDMWLNGDKIKTHQKQSEGKRQEIITGSILYSFLPLIYGVEETTNDISVPTLHSVSSCKRSMNIC